MGLCVLVAMASRAWAGTTVYWNDVEKEEAGPEWSVRRTAVTPRGDRRYLGPFRSERVGLKLGGLPRHAYLRVSCELFVMGTWDGNAAPPGTPRRGTGQGGPVGPDVWKMGIEGGATLVEATFSNLDFYTRQAEDEARTQSYPSVLAGDSFPAKTGAAERDTLGCQWVFDGAARPMDSVYRFSFVVPHDAASVALYFAGGAGLQPGDDECWGLKNVKVEALDAGEVARLSENDMRRLWEAVGGRDPMAEADAFWRLVAGGDETARFLAGRVKRAAGVDRARFAGLVAALDGADFSARERATAAIRAMGPGAAALVREAIERADSAETRSRLAGVLEAMKGGAAGEGGAEARRYRVAVRLLGVIGTAEARRVLGELGG